MDMVYGYNDELNYLYEMCRYEGQKVNYFRKYETFIVSKVSAFP